MGTNSSKGGKFIGKSHVEGGIPLVVPESKQKIEVEGEEPLITVEALRDNVVRTYKGTNFQILSQINQSVGAKAISQKATEIHAGDVIICKKTLQDKTVKELTGTNKQIVSAINADAGCKVIESGAKMTKNGQIKQFKKGGKTDLNIKVYTKKELEARSQKKKDSIQNLARNVKKLRNKVNEDLKSENEKDFLTALAVYTMLETSERVGNGVSADNGHYGVTGFKKKHLKLSDGTVRLVYKGKSGVEHDKVINNQKLATLFKKAIKNSSSNNVFTTSDGFDIKSDRVNRFLKSFDVTAKDIRGYSANKWMVSKLSRLTPEEDEKKRKKQFNKVAKEVAQKVGHGASTLKKHYMLPEIMDEWIEKGKVVDLSQFQDMFKSGGETKTKKVAPKKPSTKKLKKGGELEKGIQVEKEHKDLYVELKKRLKTKGVPMVMTENEFYKKIAEAHLKESKDYYKLLEKMEKEAGIMAEGGQTNKRYFAEVDYFVYADSPEKAEKEARRIADEINKKYDNQANVIHLHEQEFGKLGSKKIFENGGETLVKNNNMDNTESFSYLDKPKEAYALFEEVVTKNPDGLFKNKNKITNIREEDGITLYDTERGGSYMADEMRPIVYEMGGQTAPAKFRQVMREFQNKELEHGTTGNTVTDKDMALAIAYSEARKIEPNYGQYEGGGETKGGYDVFKVVYIDGDEPIIEEHDYWADAQEAFTKHKEHGHKPRLEGWSGDEFDMIYHQQLYGKGDKVKMFDDEPELIITKVNTWSDKHPTYDMKSDDGSIKRSNISQTKILGYYAKGGQTSKSGKINFNPKNIEQFKKSLEQADSLSKEGKNSPYSEAVAHIQSSYFDNYVSYNPTLLTEMLKAVKGVRASDRFRFDLLLEFALNKGVDKGYVRFFENLKDPLWKLIPEEWKKVSKVKQIPFKPTPTDENLGKIMDLYSGKDELRPALSGVYFDVENKKIAATDAHVMLLVNAKPEVSGDEICLMGGNKTKELKKLREIEKELFEEYKQRGDSAGDKKSFDSYKAQVNKRLGLFEKSKDGCLIVDGKYPNYMSVIPRDFSEVVTVNTYDLYKYLTILSKHKLVNDTTKQSVLKYGDFRIGVNSVLAAKVLKSMLWLGHTEVDVLLPHKEVRAILFAPKGKSRDVGYSIDTDVALLMPVMLRVDETYTWEYDLERKCIENEGLERLGCVQIDDDSEKSPEQSIKVGDFVFPKVKSEYVYYVDSEEKGKFKLIEIHNLVSVDGGDGSDFTRVNEKDVNRFQRIFNGKKRRAKTDKLREDYPVVLEFSESKLDYPKGYYDIESLEKEFKTLGAEGLKKDTYIKNKVWIEGYPTELIVYIGKNKEDYNPKNQTLLSWLETQDKDFAFHNYSEIYTQDLVAKNAEMKKKIGVLEAQKNEAIESLEVLLSFSKGEDAKKIKARIKELKAVGKKPKGKKPAAKKTKKLYDTHAKRLKFIKKGNIVTFKKPFNWKGDKVGQMLISEVEKSRKSGAVKLHSMGKMTGWYKSMDDLINDLDWKKMEAWHTPDSAYMADGGVLKDFKYNPEVDYLAEYDKLPKEVYDIITGLETDEPSYEESEDYLKRLKPLGWTFEYGLDGGWYSLRPIGEPEQEFKKGGETQKDKVILVVVDENMLGYVLPMNNFVSVLHASMLKGSYYRESNPPYIHDVKSIRLASEKDFGDYRNVFDGFDNKDEYVYAEDEGSTSYTVNKIPNETFRPFGVYATHKDFSDGHGGSSMLIGTYETRKEAGERIKKELAKTEFEIGGQIDDPKERAEKTFLKNKGYDRLVSTLVFYPKSNDGIELVMAEGKGKHAMAYFVGYQENDLMNIDKVLLEELAGIYSKVHGVVKLFTNAGVDVHSSKKGKYKNLEIIKVPFSEIKFEKGGEIEDLEGKSLSDGGYKFHIIKFDRTLPNGEKEYSAHQYRHNTEHDSWGYEGESKIALLPEAIKDLLAGGNAGAGGYSRLKLSTEDEGKYKAKIKNIHWETRFGDDPQTEENFFKDMAAKHNVKILFFNGHTSVSDISFDVVGTKNDIKSFMRAIWEDYFELMGHSSEEFESQLIPINEDGGQTGYTIGDEGMYQGGEVKIMKILDGKYELSEIHEDNKGNPHLGGSFEVDKSDFDAAFSKFPTSDVPMLASGGEISDMSYNVLYDCHVGGERPSEAIVKREVDKLISDSGMSSSELMDLCEFDTSNYMYEDGGELKKGTHVVVSIAPDGYWVVNTIPTSKYKAEKFAKDFTPVKGEKVAVKTLNKVKKHKQVMGREYLETGGQVKAKRRTKAEMAQARYEAEVDKYNWYIIDPKTKKVLTGFESKDDANEARKDMDLDENDKDTKAHKVVSKRGLNAMGIENPNEEWKKMENGGSLDLTIGDKTNLGVIDDATETQYQINGNWYHKSLVSPSDDVIKPQRNIPTEIDPNLIVSAFENAMDWDKVNEYTDKMKAEGLEHGFPPIKGFPSEITEEDVGNIWLNGDEITSDDLGKKIWKVTDGHHRSVSAINAQIPYIKTELDYSTITDEKELELYN